MPASLEAVRDSSDVDARATGIGALAQFHHRIDDFAVTLDVLMQHLQQTENQKRSTCETRFESGNRSPKGKSADGLAGEVGVERRPR